MTNPQTWTPNHIIGRILRLVTPRGEASDSAWIVRTYANGSVRVESLTTRERTVVEWSLLRAYLNEQRIRLEDM